MSTIEEIYANLIESGLTIKHLDAYMKSNDWADSLSRFRAITDEMSNLYSRKRRDYGNSFDISLDADGLLVSKIRLEDKFLRFQSLIKKGEALVKDESIRDTLIDMANYSIMTIMWMDANTKMGIDYSSGKDYTAIAKSVPIGDGNYEVSVTLAEPYQEECDWCGADTICFKFPKSDGMPGDICKSCHHTVTHPVI